MSAADDDDDDDDGVRDVSVQKGEKLRNGCPSAHLNGGAWLGALPGWRIPLMNDMLY